MSTETTRAEHLAWCKQRANQYVEIGEYANAVASMMSDINKHPETSIDSGGIISALGLMADMSGNRDEVQRYISGFN